MAKIALGTGREAFQADCIRALIVEFICTFLFVFAGVGSAMGSGTTFFFSQMPPTVFSGGHVRHTDKELLSFFFLQECLRLFYNTLDLKFVIYLFE